MQLVRRVESLAQDLRYAIRMLRRSAGFTTIAVVSLALGIGANTAIFQLLDAVRLRNLPVDHPEELAEVRIVGGNGGMGLNPGHYGGLTRPIWEEIRREHPAFKDVFAWDLNQGTVGRGGELRRVNRLRVSGELFGVLGVQPWRGRLILPEDEKTTCPSSVVVVSHGYWQHTMGGREIGTGTTLIVNGELKQVVGVTPPWFFGLAVGDSFDIAVPYCLPKELRRDVFDVTVMGRLLPGWTLSRASAQLETASSSIFEATALTGYGAKTIETYKRFRLAAYPASSGVSWLRSSYDVSLWLLLALTGLVLLIACTNLANLILARASTRERELAVREALGASRGRLLQQSIAESALLALIGGTLAIGLAQLLSRALVRSISTETAAVALPMTVDGRVPLFAGAVAVLTCILFGLAPALQATRVAPAVAMKSDGRGLTSSRERLSMRRFLVVTQVAVSLVLLVGALLFVRTFRNLTTLDAGLRQNGIIVGFLGFPGNEGPKERHEAFQLQLLNEVRAIPGVLGAATTTNVPLLGSSWEHGVRVGVVKGSSKFTWVSPGYFSTMGISLVDGRDFEQTDTGSSRKVAVVNQTFVRRFLGHVNPIGRVMRTSPEPGYPATDYEIVGVVADTRYSDLRGETPPMTFAPGSQFPALGSWATLMIHAEVAPPAAIGAVRRAITTKYPESVIELAVFRTQIRDRLVRERLMAMLSGFFGLVAALLAMVGLYGVISYLVARRRSEIGIRLALGARPGQVVRMVMREAGRLIIIGTLIGVALSLVAGRSASSLLFGLTPYDPATLGAACVLLAGVAACASFLPARRAARLDPMIALRHE